MPTFLFWLSSTNRVGAGVEWSEGRIDAEKACLRSLPKLQLRLLFNPPRQPPINLGLRLEPITPLLSWMAQGPETRPCELVCDHLQPELNILSVEPGLRFEFADEQLRYRTILRRRY